MSRYGIQIEGAVGSSERLDSAIAGLTNQLRDKVSSSPGRRRRVVLQNSFGDLMEDIGGLLIPVLNKLVGFIQGLIKSFNGLDKGTKVIIIAIGGVIAIRSGNFIVWSVSRSNFME